MASLLVTGGTGSFGREFVRTLLTQLKQDPFPVQPWPVGRVVVFSRDELKQLEMRAEFTDERVRFFIGDVRDRDRLRRAMAGVDVVVHAAALKQVGACEYNPIEAVRTNVDGAVNVIEAALDAGVGRVLALGTDKGVDPTNLYGATKLVAEKLFVDANAYSGAAGTRFSCTRYGNVIGSRGSVLPLFLSQHAAGLPLTVTAPSMTRFVLTLEQGVRFVLDRLTEMRGGEVFVPKPPAVSLSTIIAAVDWPRVPPYEVVGIGPGEKQHELLISEHEARRTFDHGTHFVVAPAGHPGFGGVPVPAGFRYASDTAEQLDVAGFRRLAGLGVTLAEAS